MPIDRMFGRYRTVLFGSTLVMVGMSWPLWVDDPDFPRVPFVSDWPAFPAVVSWFVLGGIVVSLALAMVGRGGRAAIGASLAFLIVAVIPDQNRLQPWVYQSLIIGIGLVGDSRGRALRMARWYTVGLYAYSGLSKLDSSFCRELGPTFLSAALEPLGLSPAGWPEASRTLAVLAMPGFEIVVAGLLASSKTRRLGLIGSMALHLSLVLVLGPWALGHSTIVLIWNAAQIAENLCLFVPTEIPEDLEASPRFSLISRGIFWFAMALPMFERWGLADAWPAHALYASHAERSDVFVHEDDVEKFPEAIRRRLGAADSTAWRRLDLTGWSRDVRGTPLYPSGRVGNAVAEFLETRYGGIQPIRLTQWGRAALFDARRESDESLGLRAIRLRGDRFWINAHPAGHKSIGLK